MLRGLNKLEIFKYEQRHFCAECYIYTKSNFFTEGKNKVYKIKDKLIKKTENTVTDGGS